MSGTSAAAASRIRSPNASEHRRAPLVAPDRGGAEHPVAEGVVVVAVRVDDDPDGGRPELAQVVEDLARLRMASCGCRARAPRPGRARRRCSGRRTRSGGRTPARRPRSSPPSCGPSYGAGRRDRLRSRGHGARRARHGAVPLDRRRPGRRRDEPAHAHLARRRRPVAIALIVHGLGEHGGRYGTVAEALTAAGIETHAYDHRGHGGSGGRRGHVEQWSQLHDDLAERIQRLRADQPDLPFVLYGHSLGGMIASGYVLSDEPRPQPDLLVLSSPALERHAGGLAARVRGAGVRAAAQAPDRARPAGRRPVA